MTTILRPVSCLAAALVLALWGVRPSDLVAQSTVPSAAPVNAAEITRQEVEKRARFLALKADDTDIHADAKWIFQHSMVVGIEDTMRVLQQEVIDSNPGKSRDELSAIFQERQKEYRMALQKEAMAVARALAPLKFEKNARDELIDERLKLQAARKNGIEVSDDEAKALVADLAGRDKMTYEQFTEHLKGMEVDIATLTEKFRAQRAWQKMRAHGAPGSPPP